MNAVILSLFTLALSLVFCGLYRRLALRWRILDRPNERSSHSEPTPHGGGVPLLLAFFVGVLVASRSGLPVATSFPVVLPFALGLMVTGVLDDIWHLPVLLRFAIYALCALLTVAILLMHVFPVIDFRYCLVVATVAIALLWLMNLFNFMDGIDGLAGLQGLFACVAAALLSAWQGGSHPYVLTCALLAMALLGFLYWNWPPARLFMGDAGSVPSGFLLGSLAILGAVDGQLPASCWIILLAPFITDASYTLIWRAATGQPVTSPHRLHAYQRLSRLWRGHLAVDLLLLAIGLFWLFPLASLVVIYPACQLILVILAYFPLLCGMVIVAKIA